MFVHVFADEYNIYIYIGSNYNPKKCRFIGGNLNLLHRQQAEIKFDVDT